MLSGNRAPQFCCGSLVRFRAGTVCVYTAPVRLDSGLCKSCVMSGVYMVLSAPRESFFPSCPRESRWKQLTAGQRDILRWKSKLNIHAERERYSDKGRQQLHSSGMCLLGSGTASARTRSQAESKRGRWRTELVRAG